MTRNELAPAWGRVIAASRRRARTGCGRKRSTRARTSSLGPMTICRFSAIGAAATKRSSGSRVWSCRLRLGRAARARSSIRRAIGCWSSCGERWRSSGERTAIVAECWYSRWIRVWGHLGVADADRVVELDRCIRRCGLEHRRRAKENPPGEVHCTDCTEAIRISTAAVSTVVDGPVLERVLLLINGKGKR